MSTEPPITRERMLAVLRSNLADSMVIDPASITVEARLIDDLGLDSLDLMDLIFTLERELGVKLGGVELDSITKVDYPRDMLTAEGFVPPADIARLSQWLPALASAEERHQLLPRQVGRYITVESLMLLIERKLLPPAM